MSEQKILFKTSEYDNKIYPVEVVKQTKCFVTYLDSDYRGRKYESKLAIENFHGTWETAQGYLIERAHVKVVAARRALELANAALGNIKGMKRPEA